VPYSFFGALPPKTYSKRAQIRKPARRLFSYPKPRKAIVLEKMEILGCKKGPGMVFSAQRSVVEIAKSEHVNEASERHVSIRICTGRAAKRVLKGARRRRCYTHLVARTLALLDLDWNFWTCHLEDDTRSAGVPDIFADLALTRTYSLICNVKNVIMMESYDAKRWWC